MYNESKDLLQLTLQGVIQNYNAMFSDDELAMKRDDMVVVVVCDGYEKLDDDFKKWARQHKLMDERKLEERGFMTKEVKKKGEKPQW